MRRFVICFLILIVCLAMTGACFSEAGTEDESIGAMISGIVRGCYPECRLLDYAPIGQEKTEYIVLAADDADRAAVMIVTHDSEALDYADVKFRMDGGTLVPVP